ncbi:MAG: permease [Deltaproteobacteria bacterium]|nr:permease [Deltaproteobacteria bacterium]
MSCAAGNSSVATWAAAAWPPLSRRRCLSLRQSRASEGATVSFLISTPQTGIDSIIATYGLLGPVFAVFRPLAAFVMGIVGGFVTQLLVGRQPAGQTAAATEPSCRLCDREEPHQHSLGAKIIAMARYGYGDFLDDISRQLTIGIILSGIITYFVPDNFFSRYAGNQLLEMLVMIVGGIPLYVCATASIPIAYALILKGISPGAAFVFLAVGPATNVATITLIGNVMGKKVVAIYLATITGLAMIAGYLFNRLIDHFYGGTLPLEPLVSEGGRQWSPATFFSYLFLALLLLSLARKYLPELRAKLDGSRRQPSPPAAAAIFRVEGMTCGNCARHVAEDLQRLAGVTGVKVDLAGKRVEVSGTCDRREAAAVIRKAGYRVVE